VKIDGAGAFLIGAADTVTFGFLDEAGAFLDTYVPGGRGGSYDDNLQRNRAIMGRAEEDYSGTYLAGQLVGGVLPVAGIGTATRAGTAAAATWRAGAARQIGSMARGGAIAGGIYGYGAADTDGMFDTARFMGAGMGAATGFAGGFVLGSVLIPAGKLAHMGIDKAVAIMRHGRSPSVKFKFGTPELTAAADDVLDDIATHRRANARLQTPTAPKDPASAPRVRMNVLTGKADDIVEDGALASTRDFTLPPADARMAILERASQLAPGAAKVLASKLEKARLSGDLASDPHFRSVLGVDLSTATDEVEAAFKAAEIFEEMTEVILAKAGMDNKSQNAIAARLRREFGASLEESDLDRAIAASSAAIGSANKGQLMMAISAVTFQKATYKLLPDVAKGLEGAREELAEQLSRAIRISAKGRWLASNAGRELGSISHGDDLAFIVQKGDKVEVEDLASISERVSKSLAALGDTEFTTLVSRVGDLNDLATVQKLLVDPDAAARMGWWMKASKSASDWIKSNTLTVGSGLVNLGGFVLHDLFRNTWARQAAAMAAKNGGDLSDALILKFQAAVVRDVRWEAHKRGLAAAGQRLKWEWLDSVDRITGVAGDKAGKAYVKKAKLEMLGSGYRAPALREMDLTGGLAITNTAAFEAKLAARTADGGGFASLVNALERTYATTVNTVDALGTATGRVVSGVMDDWGRSYVKVTEAYAQMTEVAVKEALTEGLDEKQMIKFVNERVAKLAEMPPREILEAVEQRLINGEELDALEKALLRRDYDASREAERVLFMDGPQTEGGRRLSSAMDLADTVAGMGMVKGILVPYNRTPTRILERGFMSYTPWAARTDEVRKVLAGGGLAARVEQARIDLGTTVIGLGMMASAAGAITVTNGGWKSSANLGGTPAFRLNLPGGGFVELGRLDPFASSLALGGMIGQAIKSFGDSPDTQGRDEALRAAYETAYMAVRDGIFERSYLTGLRDFMKTISSEEEGGFAGGAFKLYSTAVARMVPLSGVSRQLNDTVSGDSVEAISFMDQLFRVVPGMSRHLPSRVDALGNEVESRFLGMAAGTTSDMDPVAKRLAELGVNITNLAKTDPTGFRLTSEEVSELRTIRGKEAVNADGMTMSETLTELMDDPAFQGLEKARKQEAVSDAMRGFNEPARAIYEERNQQYLADRELHRSFKEYMATQIDRREALYSAQQDAAAGGLTPSRAPSPF
jgi:hypothetical protein